MGTTIYPDCDLPWKLGYHTQCDWGFWLLNCHRLDDDIMVTATFYDLHKVYSTIIRESDEIDWFLCSVDITTVKVLGVLCFY